jgi:hypothetical protein
MFKKTDFKNIAIISAIILVIGIYLITTTVLIAKDGTFYIDCAKQFSTNNFIQAVDNIPAAPGYPFLIYLMYKTISVFTNVDSLQRWIVSAQTVSLFSKLIASIVLYFIGSFLVSRKAAFWGVLILSVLSDSAEYGSDALTEWSYIMFLAFGFLMLLWGSRFRNIWMFALAGAAAGICYFVRSEGCQLIFYGSVWLTYCIIRPKNYISRPKAIAALVLLTAGFAITTFPYMLSQGYVFPDQQLIKIPELISSCDANNYLAGLFGSTMGNKNLMKNICETLVYYFVPGLVIGCWYYFRKQSKTIEQTFYSSAFIILNIVICLWQLYGRQLHCLNFLSRRHTFALVVFTIFYIPIGIEFISEWLNKKNKMPDKNRKLFIILILIGIFICGIKLFRSTPLRWDRKSYREVSTWLNKNTPITASIAADDARIPFYAERKWIMCYQQNPVGKADYLVRIVNKNSDFKNDENLKEEYSLWMEGNKKKLLVYKIQQ